MNQNLLIAITAMKGETGQMIGWRVPIRAAEEADRQALEGKKRFGDENNRFGFAIFSIFCDL